MTSGARLAALVGAGDATLRPLTSGTSRGTSAVITDTGREYVLQEQLDGDTRTHLPAALEADLLRAAAAVGVPVPPVVAASDDPGVLGRPFVLTERVAGESIPRRILRDPSLAPARSRLAGQLGAAVAHLQTAAPPSGLETADALDELRRKADELALARPAMEVGFAWLERHRPPPGPTVLVHGDLRLGNVLVDAGGLAAVLDWELAHLGHPLEDLGWLCVPSWRFGQDLPVGGVGTYDDLLAGYASVLPDGAPDRAALAWWVVLGTLRWGVICADQAQTFLDGAVPSHELAAIGRRISETERDVLVLTGTLDPTVAAPEPAVTPVPFDVPSGTDLIAALDGWLSRLELPGSGAYEARVARTILATLGRETALGPDILATRARSLGALGLADEAALAAALRSGSLDARQPDVRRVVTQLTVDRLAVNDPGYRGASTSEV